MALHALLYVKDLARCVQFYDAVFGMGPVFATRTDEFAEFELDEAKLMLHAIPAHIAETIDITVPPQVREDTPIKPIFDRWASDPIDPATVRANGGVVIERPWGTVDFADPEGNVFGINYFR